LCYNLLTQGYTSVVVAVAAAAWCELLTEEAVLPADIHHGCMLIPVAASWGERMPFCKVSPDALGVKVLTLRS
jgi:hypothetical protein